MSGGERILFHLIHYYLDEFHGNNLGGWKKLSESLQFNLEEQNVEKFIEIEEIFLLSIF